MRRRSLSRSVFAPCVRVNNQHSHILGALKLFVIYSPNPLLFFASFNFDSWLGSCSQHLFRLSLWEPGE